MLDERRQHPPPRWGTVILIFAAVFLFGVFVGALCEAIVMFRAPTQ
jgi:hypothetical protein